jgi:hypothetical protein
MSTVAIQDDPWLICIPSTLGFDQMDVYFEDISELREDDFRPAVEIELVDELE